MTTGVQLCPRILQKGWLEVRVALFWLLFLWLLFLILLLPLLHLRCACATSWLAHLTLINAKTHTNQLQSPSRQIARVMNPYWEALRADEDTTVIVSIATRAAARAVIGASSSSSSLTNQLRSMRIDPFGKI